MVKLHKDDQIQILEFEQIQKPNQIRSTTNTQEVVPIIAPASEVRLATTDISFESKL